MFGVSVLIMNAAVEGMANLAEALKGWRKTAKAGKFMYVESC